MKKACYIGPSVHLHGRTALVMLGRFCCGLVRDYTTKSAINPDDVRFVVAQFDDMALPEAFGWWAFPIEHFEAVPE